MNRSRVGSLPILMGLFGKRVKVDKPSRLSRGWPRQCGMPSCFDHPWCASTAAPSAGPGRRRTQSTARCWWAPVQTDLHHRAVEGQANDVLVRQGAVVPAFAVRRELAPDATDRSLPTESLPTEPLNSAPKAHCARRVFVPARWGGVISKHPRQQAWGGGAVPGQ